MSLIRRGFFAGSGSAAFSEFYACDAALQLTGKYDSSTKALVAPVTIAYLGTATYDLAVPRVNQTQRFEERGCKVINVCVTDPAMTPSRSELDAVFAAADMVLVSGGNTLFAVNRWHECGVSDILRATAARGAVMAGGSAGAICWFDSGHSDSMDPETYKEHMLRVAARASGQDEASDANDLVKKEWRYIRIQGLGLLPGLLCPHHDRTQSNGVPRSDDFDKMLLRHAGERGIAIDHWAAIAICDDSYTIVSTPGKPGSLIMTEKGEAQFVVDGSGVPTVWVKEVDPSSDGVITIRNAGTGGKVEELFRKAVALVVDPLEAVCTQENPASGAL